MTNCILLKMKIPITFKLECINYLIVANKILYVLLACLIIKALNCSAWGDETLYVDALIKLGWKGSNKDSVLVLFSSISECEPCKKEIEYWNTLRSDENDLLETILVISEKI